MNEDYSTKRPPLPVLPQYPLSRTVHEEQMIVFATWLSNLELDEAETRIMGFLCGILGRMPAINEERLAKAMEMDMHELSRHLNSLSKKRLVRRHMYGRVAVTYEVAQAFGIDPKLDMREGGCILWVVLVLGIVVVLTVLSI